MLKPIAQLGAEVEASWNAAGRQPETLTEIATRALESARLCDQISLDDMLEWHAQSPAAQRPPFSEFPVELWRSGDLVIWAYVWLDLATGVHDHGFAGAFTLVEGESIEVSYEFEATTRLTPRLHLGELRRREVRRLRPGDVRSIVPGGSYIHAVFQLRRPTVTVLIKNTRAVVGDVFSYARSLAYFPFALGTVKSTLDAIAFGAALGRASAFKLARSLCDQGDPYLAFQALRALHRTPARGSEGYVHVLEHLRAHDSGVLDAMLTALESEDRLLNVLLRRERTSAVEGRFLLALCLFAHGRDDALTLTADLVAKRDPVAVLVEAFAALPSSVIGVDPDPVVCACFEALLRDQDDTRVVADLCDRFGDEEPELANELPELLADMRGHRLLGPLFGAS